MKKLSTLFPMGKDSSGNENYKHSFLILKRLSVFCLIFFMAGISFGQERNKQVNQNTDFDANILVNQGGYKKLNLEKSDPLYQKLNQLKKTDSYKDIKEKGDPGSDKAKIKIENNEKKDDKTFQDGIRRSPFEAVKGKREVVSKRNLYSRTYDNGDGSYTTLIGAGPIHYERSGQFLDINYKITQNFDQTYPFVNATNLFQSYFGSTSHTGLKNKTDDGEIREFLNTKMYWEVNGQPYGLINSANTPIQIEDDKAYYRNLYGSIDVEFTMLTGKRELNYIIPNKAALGDIPANAQYLVFSEDVILPFGWTHEITENGIMIKNALGQNVFLYPNPVSKDELTKFKIERNTIYDTEVIGNILTVKTKVAISWLLDNNRVFPVKVDPTVTVYTEWTGMSTNAGGWASDPSAGRWSDGNNMAGFAKFDLTPVPGGSTINSVTSYFYYYDRVGNYGGSRAVVIRDINVDPVVAAQSSYASIISSSTMQISSNSQAIGGNNYGDKVHNFNNNGKAFVENNIDQGWTAVCVYPSGAWDNNNFAVFGGHDFWPIDPFMVIDYTAPAICQPRTLIGPDALYIDDVRFYGGLNQNDVENLASGYKYGYQDFTYLSNKPVQAQGQVLNMHLISASSISGVGKWRGTYKAWVDWNKNGVFENSELVYNIYPALSNIGLFGFVIPSGQTPGDYRIRVRIQNQLFIPDNDNDAYEWGADSSFGPCEDFGAFIGYDPSLGWGVGVELGEAEDYLFTVIQDCPNSRITKINTGADHGQRCGEGKVKISAEAVVTAGTTYKWFTSKYGGTLLETNSGTYTTDTLPPGTYTYWVTAVVSGCETVERYPVTARVDSTSDLDLTIEEGEICGEESNIKVSSIGDFEEVPLIDEKFNSGLGKFKYVSSPAGYNDANWVNRSNPYQANYNMYKPAMSSGYFNGNFAASITNVARTVPITKILELTNSENASELTDLKLEFDLYFQTYIGGDINSEYFSVQVSTTGGAPWTTLSPVYINTVGNPGKFIRQDFDLSAYDGEPNLKIRFVNYSTGDGDGTMPTIAALDNIRLYGKKALQPDFEWSAPNLDLFEPDCNTPYTSGSFSEICIKPTESQLENYSEWTITSTGNLSNGCSVNGTIEINNNTKIWNSTNDDWAVDTDWKPYPGGIQANGTVPTADNCVIVKRTVYLNTGTDGFGKNMTVRDDGHLEIKDGASLTITDFIHNERGLDHFIVKHNGNLLQINGNTSINSGEITVEKDFNFSTERKQYNYVTSPVVSSANFMRTSIYDPHPLSLQKYNPADDYFYESMGAYVSGLAYAVQESPGSGTATVAGKLMGVPFNGPLNYSLNTSGNRYNLLGNPYPSNLDIKALYDDNSTKINSDFYFWDNRSNTEFVQQGSNYNGVQYAIFNAATTNEGTGTPAPTNSGSTAYTPDRYVKVGTGFMVQAINAGPLNFINGYRTVNGSIDFFGKGFGPESEPDRYWLSMDTPGNLRVTNAVAYFEGGNNAYAIDDTGSFKGSDDLYTFADGHPLAIQGKAPFEINDQIQLGYKAFETGTHIISVYKAEGIFAESQNIYLIDKLLNKTVKITDKPYKFMTRAGQYNDRFVIVYRPGNVIGTASDISNQILFAKVNNQIVITSTIDKITEIELFNLNSRSVYKKSDINSNEHRIDALNFNHQIVVVTVKTETGEFVTRKFVNN